jgi:transposase
VSTESSTSTICKLHLDEISRNVAEGAHAVRLLNRARWHTTGKLHVPKNIMQIFLPSRAPELNPVENVWRYLRQNWLSNPVFENCDAIVDAAATQAAANRIEIRSPSRLSRRVGGVRGVDKRKAVTR